MNPILSLIIPCYNSEATLESTLESVIGQDFQDWEALIINDGSTDTTEEIALRWVNKDKRFKYYSKQNEGLGKTRNYGIAKSNGLYILPLDSDNQLIHDFTQAAIAVLENNHDIGVVYGNAEYFGERTGLWNVNQFDFNKILVNNYIDACAIYRKKIWELVGGYDDKMPFQGEEDWEFWIALGALDVKFYHLNKTTFKYYVSKNSMIRSFTEEMAISNYNYILKKYSDQYQKKYKDVYLLYEKNERQFAANLKSEKFVIDLFCSTFFKFSIFGLYKNKKK